MFFRFGRVFTFSDVFWVYDFDFGGICFRIVFLGGREVGR